jgi:hypothetical protein
MAKSPRSEMRRKLVSYLQSPPPGRSSAPSKHMLVASTTTPMTLHRCSTSWSRERHHTDVTMSCVTSALPRVTIYEERGLPDRSLWWGGQRPPRCGEGGGRTGVDMWIGGEVSRWLCPRVRQADRGDSRDGRSERIWEAKRGK